MEKISSIFWVSEEFTDGDFNHSATVVLDINYRSNGFSVTPYCGSNDEKFDMRYAGNKPELSKAVAKAIVKAIELAQKELENVPPDQIPK